MKLNINKDCVIAGAGIAGCFLALQLEKLGYSVTIFEKSSKKEILSLASKRSYNLTLYGYGLNLLRKAGLWHDIKNHVIKLEGSTTFLPNKTTPRIAKNHKKSPYFAISRAQLLLVLLNKVEKNKKSKVHFDSEIRSINKKTKTIKVLNSKKRTTKEFSYTLLAGCDGINSKVRDTLLKSADSYLTKEYFGWVYKQILISYKKAQDLKINVNMANTWSSSNFVIASFPNKDKSISAILVYPKSNPPKFLSISKKFPMLTNLKKEFDEAINHPEGRFVTIHTNPWVYDDSIFLLGDSAHGFNPFFGQGISAAMGDVIELCNCLKEIYDRKSALLMYQKKRKINMDTLGELSKEGFERYKRSKLADYNVIYDRFETVLSKHFPNQISPSIFDSISENPDNTYLYFNRRHEQRKKMSYIGVPIGVYLTTLAVNLYDRFSR